MRLHVPVLKEEICSCLMRELAERSHFIGIDATLGAGGHTEAILDQMSGCRIIAFDQDKTARELAAQRLERFGDRLIIVPTNFANISRELICEMSDGAHVGAVLFDLGVSMMQLTAPERGFSYDEDGPLDMRMDASGTDVTAASIIEDHDVAELTRIFRLYGEEHHAYRIASGIVSARERGALPETTGELVALIRKILPAPVQRKMGGHPARRVFQALRIEVNSEMEVLERGLDGALDCADDGAVIAVISYHSLEDRIVKHRFKEWASGGQGVILTKRPISPSDEEIETNRSARSAKLRIFKKMA